MPSFPIAAVIGAGACGITAAKALHQRGIEFDCELFRRQWHPDLPNLVFVGLAQPLGAIMPLAEAQGRWTAEYLRGEYHLPPRQEMLADIRRDAESMGKRYVASKRHTIQVDFDEFLWNMHKERRAGAERAKAAGFALPVPPRAREPVAA